VISFGEENAIFNALSFAIVKFAHLDAICKAVHRLAQFYGWGGNGEMMDEFVPIEEVCGRSEAHSRPFRSFSSPPYRMLAFRLRSNRPRQTDKQDQIRSEARSCLPMVAENVR
jgi:hypothetical protein